MLASSENSYESYGNRYSKGSREAEYEILLKVTRELKESIRSRESDYARFVSAIGNNERLWTMFMVDLLGEDNQLPATLKASLISLSGFVKKHSRAILIEDANVQPLLEINVSILKGLGEVVTQR